jgi:predicted nuclease of restriction endonuclease-like (RecB) superfamily
MGVIKRKITIKTNHFMNFDLLTNTILETHTSLQQSAVKAVNVHLTVRNWLIGFYIVEFEQHGEDRAKYGDKLIDAIAKKLNHIKGIDRRSLFRFRALYIYYPQIGQFLKKSSILDNLIPTLSDVPIVGLSTPLLQNTPFLSGEKILYSLSYTHIEQLLAIENSLKRNFYEIEAIKGTWSVSELKRQIGSLYFERSGMSINPEKLREITNEKAEINTNSELIKSPFVFEFLGLKTHEAILEEDLEAALVENLQEFILELGHGFCFESRQRRILIDEEYYFVDLVFYHRILKCHVLLELKADVFKPEYASQLNTYVAYFNEEVRRQDDNPTIGILLCTEKGKKLVDYALAGMDENLFVSKYLVELPTEQQFISFISRDLKE